MKPEPSFSHVFKLNTASVFSSKLRIGVEFGLQYFTRAAHAAPDRIGRHAGRGRDFVNRVTEYDAHRESFRLFFGQLAQ